MTAANALAALALLFWGIVVDSAVRAPVSPQVRFDNLTTISLGSGMGTILHIVNDLGRSATKGAVRQTLVRFSG